MFCGNCGTENTDSAEFCKECGKPLKNTAKKKVILQQGGQVSGTGQAARVNADRMKEKIKSLPKKVLMGTVIAVIALIVIVCVAVKSGSTINLDKYVNIEDLGYDGYGSVEASVDWDAIEEKYGDKISFTKKASEEYGGLLKYMKPVEVLQDYIRIRLDSPDGLSNGDTVTYSWDVNEDFNTYLKCKIKCKGGSHTISELTKVDIFDAFADLEVTFDGVAPYGEVNINYNGSELNNHDFTCNPSDGLSNGDTITISIDGKDMEYFAETFGKIPEAAEKTYTVEGLESYLSKLAEIEESAMADMQNQASDVFNSHVAKTWEDDEELKNFTYMGEYLLTAKNTDFYGDNKNVLYLIYKAQVKNSYSNDEDSYNKVNDIYWYIKYTDLVVGDDGKVTVDITSYDTPGNRFTIDSGVSSGWFSTKSWYYYGYETLDELYKDVVTSNMDSYNHEDNVDEDGVPGTAVEKEVTTGGEYIFPDSDTELLTEEDLKGLSAEECQIARNEIYARHGRKFKDMEIQVYFDSLDWYEGLVDPDDFDESELSDIEIANKNLIYAYEKKKGYR